MNNINKKLLFAILMIFCTSVSFANIKTTSDDVTADIIKENQITSDLEIKKSEDSNKKDQDDSNFDIKKNEQEKDISKATIKESAEELAEIYIKSCTTEANKSLRELKLNQLSEDSDKVDEDAIKLWKINFLTFFDKEKKDDFENSLRAGTISLEEYARAVFLIMQYAKNHRTKADQTPKSSITFEAMLEKELEKQKKDYELKNSNKKFNFNKKAISEGGNFDLNKAYRSIIDLSTKIKIKDSTLKGCYKWCPKFLCDYTVGLFW